ncbi:MAG: putative rane protein [Acidimicrobiales bacterium]|nr:putative rane protein [Acidimicrobiales bacterium]
MDDERGMPEVTSADPEVEAHHRDLHERLSELEARVTGDVRKGVDSTFVPAWSRLTKGEIRWPVTAAIVAALAMQASLPDNLVFGPPWLIPSVGGALTIALVAANPHRIDRASKALRYLGLALIATISAANVDSAIRLIVRLLTVGETDAVRLLRTGGAIWLTNVIIFALWYWEFDRGGPVERMIASHPYPDFLFPQMESPELAPRDWEPYFVDYFYFSFTNASAFSPTDVMPLSRWAKLAMLVQSAVSLVTVALVVARAVNILK